MVLPKDRVSCWILCPFFCYNREKRRAQMDEAHVYIAIDLKSFYASVECVERGLDPLTTNLVAADPERTPLLAGAGSEDRKPIPGQKIER